MGQKRIITHLDMDSFFASVELLHRPELEGLAFAVAGDSPKSVLTTCSYEARKYGVRSAMPLFLALKHCPHLKVVPPRFERYKEVSSAIMSQLAMEFQTIQVLGIDELFVDLTDDVSTYIEGARRVEQLRSTIHRLHGVTVSAGIAPNKLLAKITSELNKPNGQYVLLPDDVDEFMIDLPLKLIPGVGPKLQRKLAGMNLLSCGDFQGLSLESCYQKFGSFGAQLYQYTRGEDDRAVEQKRTRKSVSVEKTFSDLLVCSVDCSERLPGLYRKLSERLESSSTQSEIRGVFLKTKDNNFQVRTSEHQVNGRPGLQIYQRLIEKFWQQNKDAKLRLLGIGVRFSDQDLAKQLKLNL